DALGLGRALMLANAAPDAPLFDDVNLSIAQLDRDIAHRARIDAAGAFFALAPHANRFIPHRRSHIDLTEGNRGERARRAVVHAGERVAHNAGHLLGMNERRAVSAAPGGIDLDALRRAHFDAFATA